MQVGDLLCDSEEEYNLSFPSPPFWFLQELAELTGVTLVPERNSEPPSADTFDCLWDSCRQTFTTRTGLATHCYVHVADLSTPRCLWDGCQATCPSVASLRKHLSQSSHVGQAPYAPRESHVVAKRFVCHFPRCGKGFNDGSNFKKHKMVHQKSRVRFHCQDCEKSYSTRTDLKIHVRVHTGEQLLRCSRFNCHRFFTKKSELYAHERAHDKTWPHRCGTCQRSFKDKGKWVNHQIKCKKQGKRR